MKRVVVKTGLKRLVVSSLTFIVVISGMASLMLGTSPSTQALVSGDDWQAGHIIDDDIFYNSNTMTVQDIQNFLDERVPNCDTNGTQMYNSTMTDAQYAATQGWPGPDYVCLKDYYQVPRSDEDINNLTTNVIPAGAISAAQIIESAADTYDINPQVLLVTIQKESLNLLNDNWPLPNQYRDPMGYGCSDSSPCDPQYEGFYNQVMNAARQFQLYKNNPNAYTNIPFQDNAILYQANDPSCGSSEVYITDYATAGLYNYTPYQPDQAALDNMYETGDSCSAYGNRNFWRDFTDWFGSPTTPESSVYIANGTYTIENSASGRVADVTGGGTSNGTLVQLYDGNGTNAQTWQITRLSNGYYTIENVGSGRYMDVSGAGTADGTPVQIYDGNSSCAQQWAAVSVDSNVLFVNVCSGKALDVTGGNLVDSTKLQMYDRNYSNAQLWSLVSTNSNPVVTNAYYTLSSTAGLEMTPSSDGTSTEIESNAGNTTQTWQLYGQPNGNYRIRNQSLNQFLTVDDNGIDAGAQLSLQAANGGCSQEWIVTLNSDSTYTVQSACYGFVLDISNGAVSTAGTAVQVYGSNSTPAQEWQLTKVADIGVSAGNYTLSDSAGKVLDVSGGVSDNGTQLQIWDSNSTPAQQWQLVQVHGDVYELVSGLAGKVADLAGASTLNGTPIQIWSSNNTCAQQWQVIDNGDNTYTFASTCDTSKVLDITGGNVSTDGTKLQLYDSNLTSAQRWTLTPL